MTTAAGFCWWAITFIAIVLVTAYDEGTLRNIGLVLAGMSVTLLASKVWKRERT